MKNRLDSRFKRGAVIKAISIATKYKFMLEPLTKFIVATLDAIFDV
jgi:hypothetical protein